MKKRGRERSEKEEYSEGGMRKRVTVREREIASEKNSQSERE